MTERRSLLVRGPADDEHWLGAECPCRPYPAQAEGFAGVVHGAGPLGRDSDAFFEAQACIDHGLHADSPGIVGMAAESLCNTPGKGRRVLSEADAIAASIAAWRAGRRDDRTVRVQVLTPRRVS